MASCRTFFGGIQQSQINAANVHAFFSSRGLDKGTTLVGVHLTDSQRYSETELNNVVEAAKSFFAINYDDCTLFTIEYNDAHNEQAREDNLWKFRRSFEPKLLQDVLELSVTYYDNQDSDNTNSLITETYYMVTLDNGNWEVGDHGRT